MRILLALDGSTSADAAAHAVRSLIWPSGSVIHVLGVIESVTDSLAPFGVRDTKRSPAALGLRHVVDSAVVSLHERDLAADATVIVGRPATVIVEAATELRAELAVVGSRGRGPITSMVLGSVSAEVVDHAPCPVLVVRRSLDGSVLVAVDGSSSSEAAVTFLVANRLLADRPIDVLTVAQPPGLPMPWVGDGYTSATLDASEERRVADRGRLENVAAQATGRLRAAGYRARWSVVEDDPARGIIDGSAALGTGLTVMGSRGTTGLRRILVGSVARNVLLHSAGSVLIVHEPIREDASEPADARHARSRLVATIV